ncbi:uncharacterized protein [Primulina eburnea]|uniref:uncharacterized protein isoform X3 n=1 Tax=Primulina eburnea TaxID=1245227 RepID=UPI003C6CC3AD
MRFEDYQPALTGPMEGHCELDLTIKPSGSTDVGQTHLDRVQFPRQGVEVTCQSNQNQYDHEPGMMVGHAYLNGSVVSKTDANTIDVRSDAYKFLIVSEMSHPAGNAEYRNSQLCMNFTQIREETASNHLGGSYRPEANTNKSQISGNFSNSGMRTSMLSHVGNATGNGNENHMNSGALQFGHPGIGDGSFLRLGIGGGMDTRANSNFSAREISSKLEEVDSSPHHNYLAQRTAGYHLNLAQSSGRAARLQFNGGGLSNVVSRTSTCEGGGLITGANGLIGSNPCASSQIPQVNIPRNFSFSADHSSGLLQDHNPLPLPYSRTLMSHPGCAVPSLMESQLPKPTYCTTQPVSAQQQNCSGKDSNHVSPEFFSTSPIDWRRGNSVRHSQLRGRQTQIADSVPFPVIIEPHEGSSPNPVNIGSCQTSLLQPTGQLFSPQNVGVTEAHGYHLFPGRTGFPVSKGSALQFVVPNSFPRRLGVQPIDFAATRAGPSQTGLDSHISHLGYTVPSGQYVRVVPSHIPKDFPKVSHTNGHFDPAAKFGGRPQAFPFPRHRSLKRGAIENSNATHPNHRRKIIPAPMIHGSVPQQRKWSPARVPNPAQMPSSPFHIKFQGSDGPPKPGGYSCFLCKRDLAFRAEGPVYQPAAPPAVAVLPCGHTFHDSCLQRITPEDQSKHPPCIPCATGET